MKNRKNIRLPNYDYSQAGYYFVAICTKDRMNYFGEIINGEMELNDAGEIVEKCIKEIPEHFPYSDVDYYCIMPNHIHAIIIISDTSIGNTYVGNTHACSLPSVCTEPRDKQLLPIIVGSFKSAASKLIHRLEGNLFFKWQKSYYEHVIRNEKELFEIRKYIELNPLNWELDEDNLQNVGAIHDLPLLYQKKL